MYTLMRFVFFLSLVIYQLEIKFSIHFVWSDISLRETIPQHFEPGPARPAIPARARPTHKSYWTGVGRDLEARKKNFGPSPARNTVFSCFTL
jgi:hypothetical protein